MQSRILHVVLFATLLSGASIANAQLLDGPRKLTRATPSPMDLDTLVKSVRRKPLNLGGFDLIEPESSRSVYNDPEVIADKAMKERARQGRLARQDEMLEGVEDTPIDRMLAVGQEALKDLYWRERAQGTEGSSLTPQEQQQFDLRTEGDWGQFPDISDADVERIRQAKTAADVEQITQELIAAAKERRPTIFWNPLFVMLGWGERLIEIGWYAWLSGIAKTFVLIALAHLVLNIARSVRATANARTPNDKHTTLEALKPTPHEEAQEQMTNNNTRADNELVRSSQLLNSPSPNAAANHESFKMEPPEAGNTLLNSSLTAIMTRLITLVQQQNATTKAALLLSGGVILGGLLVPWLTSSGSTSSGKWEIKHVESPARRESATYKVNERTGETYLLTNGVWVKVNTLDPPK